MPESDKRLVAPSFIISAWNPNGEPAFENDKDDANDRLERDLARKYGQKFLAALTDSTLEVILVDALTLANSKPLEVLELPAAPCPLLIEFEAENECHPCGDPWPSSSIEAAAIWSFQSKLLVNALGCSACKRSGAIPINPATVPGRFGGWQWMPRKVA